MTYGAIAGLLQRGGPRGVGGVMARDGPMVPWWRVVRANGTVPSHLVIDAQQPGSARAPRPVAGSLTSKGPGGCPTTRRTPIPPPRT